MVSIYFYKISGGEKTYEVDFLVFAFLGLFWEWSIEWQSFFPVENAWNILGCFGIRKIRRHTVRICKDLCAF